MRISGKSGEEATFYLSTGTGNSLKSSTASLRLGAFVMWKIFHVFTGEVENRTAHRPKSTGHCLVVSTNADIATERMLLLYEQQHEQSRYRSLHGLRKRRTPEGKPQCGLLFGGGEGTLGLLTPGPRL